MRKSAIEVVMHLQDHGYEAVLAGGCVRDELLGEKPKDYDIATNARPQDVENIFGDTLPIGKAFGVIQVRCNDHKFEVATFRNDSARGDGRRPDCVRFSTMKEDADRRDFTINAMFYDPIADKLYDFHDGESDLERRTLRFVGDPKYRIYEDKLRMMRAIRFIVTKALKIDPAHWEAIKDNAGDIRIISWERIREEFNRMFNIYPDSTIYYMEASGLMKYILPEVSILRSIEQSPNYHPEGNALNHTYKALTVAGGMPLEVKWSILLHDIGKYNTQTIGDDGIYHFYGHHEVSANLATEILARFKFPNKFTKKVVWLVRNHMRPFLAPNMRDAKLKRLIGHEWIHELLAVHYADKMGSNKDKTTINFMSKTFKMFPPEEIRPPKLVTGNDLIGAGFKAGRIFKDILDYIEELQLEGIISTKEEALNKVKERWRHDDSNRYTEQGQFL